MDAINQIFALFRVNYHNQYYAAFSDTQLLNQTKKLWLDSLSRFSSATILHAAKQAIERSEYLPTLHKMITYCQGDPASHGLPDAHRAYLEACHAPSPKAAYAWSHPAVYFAGRDTDWFFLGSSPEYVAFPLFKQQYQRWCEKVMAGEALPEIQVKMIEAETATPLSKEENRDRLKSLRKELKI
ncbi:replication protein P [Gilvimarinus sp. F26214L]|uniref:replication protein P n=1 Tax=Gilvimarinus sp. DZF01 TaxID=3461371 RepID=UPI004045F83D